MTLKKIILSICLAGFTAILFLAPEASAFLWFSRKETKPVSSAPAVEIKKTLTLKDAYALALARSETIAIQGAMIEEAHGRFYEACSVILPTVNFSMTRFDQDATPKGESGGGSGGEGASSNLLRPSTPQKKFTFHQPLFSGFKEFAALAAGGADNKGQELRYRRAKELLWLDVADSFYALLQAEQDVAILKETEDIMEKRINDLRAREKIGRSRPSEAQSAIADQKLAEAELVSARGTERMARELFEFYIGRSLEQELLDDLDLQQQLSDPLYYLSKSDKRADVCAAEQDYILAQKKVISAQSGFFPSVYLDGNYYTQRVGFQSGIDWDTTLTFNVPIFDGMETIGKVRESASQKDQARLQWEKTRRLAALEIQQKYDSFRAGLEEEEAYNAARQAAQENYRLQAEDYKLNLVNNLNVLDALRRYKEIYRDWNVSYYETKKNYWALKVASGEIE